MIWFNWIASSSSVTQSESGPVYQRRRDILLFIYLLIYCFLKYIFISSSIQYGLGPLTVILCHHTCAQHFQSTHLKLGEWPNSKGVTFHFFLSATFCSRSVVQNNLDFSSQGGSTKKYICVIVVLCVCVHRLFLLICVTVSLCPLVCKSSLLEST